MVAESEIALTKPQRKWLLWDTSVVVPYYLPEVTKNQKAADRAPIICDAVRHHRLDAVCYIPNIVVAETFGVFDRECFSAWDPDVNKHYPGRQKTLNGKRYSSVRNKFRRDIHNGALFYQLELNRYHILALDLVAPVDKHLKYYRTKRTRSMGASDLLIGAMAMHLTKTHGRDNVCLLTADRRMDAIFAKTCPGLAEGTARKLKLDKTSTKLGFGKWRPEIYPQVLDLQRCSNKRLKDFFGEWPLNTRKTRGRAPKA